MVITLWISIKKTAITSLGMSLSAFSALAGPAFETNKPSSQDVKEHRAKITVIPITANFFIVLPPY
jgi:hypothetical protein